MASIYHRISRISKIFAIFLFLVCVLGITNKAHAGITKPDFISPTPIDNATTSAGSSATVSVSSTAIGAEHSLVLDWNRTLLGWWRFNTSGDLTDYSSYGNTLTNNNSAVWTASGKYAGGYSFDPNNSTYLNTASSSMTINGGDSYTISVWAKATSTNESLILSLGNFNDNNGSFNSFLYLANGGKVHYSLRQNSAGDWVEVFSGANTSANTWHHIVIVNDRTNLKVYVDGALSNTQSLGNFSTYYVRYDVKIGKDDWNNKYSGYVDDVQIYRRALSTTEIGALYNANSTQYQATFSNLTLGNISYNAYIQNTAGATSSADGRTLKVVPPLAEAPTNLSSESGSMGSTAFLSWTAPSNSASAYITNYAISYYKEGAAAWGNTVITSDNSTNYLVTGLTSTLTNYYFKVAAINVTGTSTYSSSSTYKTPEELASAPYNINGYESDLGYTAVNLNWAQPTSTGMGAIERYIIRYYKEGEGLPYLVTTTQDANLSMDITGLTATNTNYYFSVAVSTTYGIGPYSAFSAYKTPVGPVSSITTCNDLQSMKYDPTGSYSLANDINCSGFDYIPVSGFIGTLNGNNHKIYNLITKYDNNQNAGIFGSIANPAHIYNLTIASSTFDDLTYGYPRDVGALAGIMYGGTVENITVLPSVTINGGSDASGGLIGYVYGESDNTITISNCSSSPVFNIVSYIYEDDYISNIGSLIGKLSIQENNITTNISNSYGGSELKFQATYPYSYLNYIGGLIGMINITSQSTTTISNSFSNSDVSGSYSIGGLIGDIEQISNEESNDLVLKIENSYATGDVYASNEFAGGLIGFVTIYKTTPGQGLVSIKNSHATGNVNGNSFLGGLLGAAYGEGGIYLGGGATGGLNIEKSYTTGAIGALDTGSSNVGGLVGGANCYNDTDNTIFACNFVGSHATGEIKGDSNVGGLIGYIRYSGVSSSYATGNVYGNSENVGGLIGSNTSGRVINTYARGNVNGFSTAYKVGGLVGNSGIPKSIINSYATGNVTGVGNVGGLVGLTADDVSNSFAVGSVTYTESGGGLFGNVDDSGVIINNYWYNDLENGMSNLGSPVYDGHWNKATSASVFKNSTTVAPLNNWLFSGDDKVWIANENDYPTLYLRAEEDVTYYTLTYNSGANGSVTGSTSQRLAGGASGSSVTAVANSGYNFVKWNEDSNTSATRSDTATADKTYTAIFEKKSSSGAAPVSTPSSVGTGSISQSVGMGQTANIGNITTKGVNYLSYISSGADFGAIVSHTNNLENHHVVISNLDLVGQTVTLVFHSATQTLNLKLGETKNLDLDGDKINDVQVKFANLWMNRAEITLTSLIKDKEKTSTGATTTSQYVFKRNLSIGMSGSDVKELQKFLNNNGFIIDSVGVGSPGKESTRFGALTQKALIKFQKANKISPAIGYFGPLTRKTVNGK